MNCTRGPMGMHWRPYGYTLQSVLVALEALWVAMEALWICTGVPMGN